ncbi:MAG: hemerythrin domain-containing protein [Burkholderiales bacterium]|nr:hemerythrin domain-containing protein [Burkholderiales bacterium]
MSTQTISPLTLHRAPAAGFDEPFAMLGACHERVERMLVLLERLAAHLPVHGADAQAASAARDVMRYFDQAAPKHHEDEELHVLPALRASGRPELVALAVRLHDDHERMSAAWAGLRASLVEIEQGRWPAGAAWPAVAPYAAAYRAHIDAENETAFPHAAEGIVGAAREAMGKEMAARRGVR